MNTNELPPDHPIHKLVARISEDIAVRFKVEHPNIEPPEIHCIPGRKYIKVDVGRSGKYMVTEDGEIFGIKGYGVIHRGHQYGTLDTIDEWFWGDYTAYRKEALNG